MADTKKSKGKKELSATEKWAAEAKKQDSSKKPRPMDLGSGGARKAADAIVKRKKMLDEI